MRTAHGQPVAAANVFVLETLDGALSDSAGRFGIRIRRAGTLTLVIRHIGFRPESLSVAPGARGGIVVMLDRVASALTPVRVEAGRYTAGEEEGATLTTLDVVGTPGAAADVNRAIQTLPGVQGVDEGTGLYVRGGDFTETRVLLDDATLLDPVQLRTPVGTFVGTVDPFLLDGIFFSSGGFGARYGNALSGVASLRTLPRPARASASVGAGLAALSARVALPLPHGLGVRLAANSMNLRPVIRLNGSARAYDPAPRGSDLSGSGVWRYRSDGEVKLFAIRQDNRVGVDDSEGAYAGTYGSGVRTSHSVLSWRDVLGPVMAGLSASAAQLDRDERFGAFRLGTRIRAASLFTHAGWAPSDRVTLSGGAEVESRKVLLDGSVPDERGAAEPGAATRVVGSERAGTRVGMFGEADTRIGSRLRIVTGLRGDHSTLTRKTTVDPRVSTALDIHGATLTAAWGIYHQVPDVILYDATIGNPALPPMRAMQVSAGAQVGEGEGVLRFEAYAKRYRDLAGQTRDYGTRGGGRGWARGSDLFFKSRGPLGLAIRGTQSLVWSRRTDPNTGAMARAPFDVTYSGTMIVERAWGAWRVATAYRQATGRPFTPVASATYDSMRAIWAPRYGPPMSDRLPGLRRIDLSTSHVRRLTPHWQVVLYASLTNVAGRANLYSYRYAPDYRSRIPVRSLLGRTLYFGFLLTRS